MEYGREIERVELFFQWNENVQNVFEFMLSKFALRKWSYFICLRCEDNFALHETTFSLYMPETGKFY